MPTRAKEVLPLPVRANLQQAQSKQSCECHVHVIYGNSHLHSHCATVASKPRLTCKFDDLPMAGIGHNRQSFRGPMAELFLPISCLAAWHVLGRHVDRELLRCHTEFLAPEPQLIARDVALTAKNLGQRRVISSEKGSKST